MRAFVAGAGGAVGEAAALALLQKGWRVTASMRRARADVSARLEAAGAAVHVGALPGAGWERGAYDAVIFTTHLSIANATLAAAAVETKRLVVFSSNNVAADAEAPSYRALAQEEATVRARYPQVAIVRPTLIYGDPRLATLTRLMNLARRAPVLPLPGSGKALVQPVFHGDLGAVAAGLAEAAAPSGVFAVGGPEVVTMRALYRALTQAARARALIVPAPGPFLALAAALKFITAEQAARAEQDRTAVPQDKLPAELAPRTPLSEGLAHLAQALANERRRGG